MTFEIPEKLGNDIIDYCVLNDIDSQDFVANLIRKSFMVIKYGETPFDNIKNTENKGEEKQKVKHTARKKEEQKEAFVVENKTEEKQETQPEAKKITKTRRELK